MWDLIGTVLSLVLGRKTPPPPAEQRITIDEGWSGLVEGLREEIQRLATKCDQLSAEVDRLRHETEQCETERDHDRRKIAALEARVLELENSGA